MTSERTDETVHSDFTLMGIVNVTPDSFSDGGRYLEAEKAIQHGLRLRAEGAGILDIGGESTRPGAAPLTVEEEISRIVPVLKGLKNCGAVLSVDTYHAATMEAALAAGAMLINDITALEGDPRSLAVAADSAADICLMHMKGTPATMQDEPDYVNVVSDIYGYLEARVEACAKAGIAVERLILDPGIGFGKNLEHNLMLLDNIDVFFDFGARVMLGASRKRFIEALCPNTSAQQRLPGSLAACLAAYDRGVRLFRVHDVAESAQALTVYRAIG